MILRSLKLENFGLYRGVTAFDLVPRRRDGHDAPIILVGGKNGAGKTTFLEALRLALYGKRALGTRVGQSEYERHLRSRVNRGSGGSVASVSLEFDYAESGEVHRYAVRREWSVRGDSVAETIELEKDGQTITSVPREEWHSFLQELIPPGLSQLFFFDGEKIQEIADGSGEEEYLADAVRGLLGIELVNRLRTDLGLYLARHRASRQGGDGIAERLEANIRDIQVAQRRVDQLFEETAELASQRDSYSRVSEQARRRFVAEGGDVALGRTRLESDIAENKTLLQAAEAELRDIANRLLPFSYAPQLVAKFKASLAASTVGAASTDVLKSVFLDLKQWPGASANWTEAHWNDLERFAKDLRTVDGEAFGDLPDKRSALSTLEAIEGGVREQGVALHQELLRLTSKAEALATSLARADSAASGTMLDDLRDADRKVGGTEAALALKQEELRTTRVLIDTLDRERSKLLDEQSRGKVGERQADLGSRAARALMEYENRLLALKLKQLQTEFVRCFSHLARKPDLVAEARIDPQSFAVALFDGQGNPVPKVDLSAGEKQIYATAMLWALARTSGRNLPMVIDTPLARLDTEHRGRLVERYFPAASHQVILLSTDSEIGDEAMQKLEPFVSHSFQLIYDHSARRSTVANGYFNNVSEEADRALQQA
ncbi:DNA sulfur modification protein DndD [Rhizobium leguminosarum]|uniref:DNA sulfur modification protein DndD n=1 Tax=Rhizobium leguminosarum TaxID=384 RepID=UPI00102F50AE|nr:DNA sulfur modification protein DndD [Rhizobium leguminosarum]TBF36998.1 DNA sulfur modification protein DndD [Rhizobium leguminosarum]